MFQQSEKMSIKKLKNLFQLENVVDKQIRTYTTCYNAVLKH